MARGEFIYKGKTLEEMQKLNLSELAALLPSRARRSLERGLSEAHKTILKKLENKDVVETRVRDMIILPKMVGKRIKVYNGKEYKEFSILPDMIGHYIGEFALTRSRVAHNAPGVGATRSSAALSVR
jgi:small subunit ribosomal protein S19